MEKIPFDIKYRDKIESGEYKVETRDGRPTRIICWDRKHGYPICGLAYEKATGCENYVNTYESGMTAINGILGTNDDLFIITPDQELSEFEKRFLEIIVEIVEEKDNECPHPLEYAAELLELAKNEIYSHESLVEYAKTSKEQGKSEVLRTRATELTENLVKSGLDKDSIPYNLIEFMCNLYTCQNWKEIEGSAELYATRIKAASMKDLPRWKKAAGYWFVGQSIMCDELGFYKSSTTKPGCRYITYESLRMLPGFNE